MINFLTFCASPFLQLSSFDFTPLRAALLDKDCKLPFIPVDPISFEIAAKADGYLLLRFRWSLFPETNLISDQRLKKSLLQNCMTDSALGQPRTPVLNCCFLHAL